VYGWDYYTYMNQPTWFVELIIERMRIDAKKQEAEAKAQRRN